MFIEGKHIGPAPNWYCCQISDINEDGLLAYGAQSSLVLIDIKAQPPIYKLIQPIHSSRIVAIVYCRLPDFTSLLATGSQDKSIKVWDVKDVPNQLTLTHELEWKARIISLDWQMKKSNSTMFVVDEDGTLFIWNLNTNKTTIIRIKMRGLPILVSACPYNPNMMAVCLKGGIIILLNGFKNTEKYKMLKGHDDDVLSLSWPPYIPSDDESQKDWSNTLDLASTSRDKTLKVWNIERQRCLKSTKPPALKHTGSKREIEKSKQWMVCSWNPASLNQIICSSCHGELFLAVIKMDHAGHWGVHWEKFDGRQNGEHNRCVFNISTFGSNMATSVSLDRQIIMWDLKRYKSTLSMPMIGGFAYALAFSPVDTGRLAIGSGDMLIRTWNTASVTGYSTNVYWQGIRGKVTQLKWHPEKENHLAYGTEEGRVGVLDILSNKPATVSNTHHQKPVYSLSWGPFTPENENEASKEKKKVWLLYSCGDGKVLIHNMSKPESDALDFDMIIGNPDENDKIQKNFRTEMAWKPDWTLLALGNKDGTVNIYSNEFKLLATLTGQAKLITNLKWHPLCTTISSETSNKHTWLACASYENVIQIYNLEAVYKLSQLKVNGATNGHTNDKHTMITTSFKQLAGHRSKVLYLAWSPHSEGKLASGSQDGSFQIWDVITGLPLVNYSGHLGECLCLEWSPQDPNIIFSGSEDCSIHQIQISKLVDKLPPPTKKSIVIKSTPPKVESSQSVTDDLDSEFDLLMAELDKKRDEISSDTIATGQSSSSKSLADKPKKKAPVKSYFTFSNKLDNQPKPIILSDIQNMSTNLSQRVIEKLPYSENSVYLAPFQDYAEVLDLVKAEKKFHEENGNQDCCYQMDVWTGDIKDTIQKAIQKKQLNDYLVSIASLESRALWLEACEKYAVQLSEEGGYGNINKAITYLLASHKVLDAINLLKERGLFKEALTIAKLRLPQDSPLVKELLLLWAERCNNDTKFEVAARCFLNLNDFASAARMLANRKDPISLKVACHIASTHNLKEEAEGYASMCVQKSLLKNQWDMVLQLVTEQQELNVIENVRSLLLFSSLHELLINGTSDQERAKLKITNPLRQIIVNMDNESYIEIWRSLFLLEEDFSSAVDLKWQSVVPDFLSNRLEMLRSIQKLFSQRKNALNKNELFYQFAIDLTLSQLSEADDECFAHICTVLNDAYKLQPQFNVLRDLCLILVPKIVNRHDLDNRSLIKGLYTLSPISKMSSEECSPQASCCAYFFSSLLDQLYAQATNLDEILLSHVHKEDDSLIEDLGCLTSQFTSVDAATLLTTSTIDETPLLIPSVCDKEKFTLTEESLHSCKPVKETSKLYTKVEGSHQSETIKEALVDIPVVKYLLGSPVDETFKSTITSEEINGTLISAKETNEATVTPIMKTIQSDTPIRESNHSRTPMVENTNLGETLNSDATTFVTIETENSYDGTAESDASKINEILKEKSNTLEICLEETQHLETSIKKSVMSETSVEETEHTETTKEDAQKFEISIQSLNTSEEAEFLNGTSNESLLLMNISEENQFLMNSREETKLPKEIASSPKASPEIASSPKASPEIASSPKASPEIASSPKASPEIASSPKASPEIASSPKASPEIASSPKASPEIASSPKASPEIASSPEASPEIASSPKASPEIASSPKASPEIASSPKASPEIASSPKASPEIASSPKASPEIASSPKASPEIASSPKASPEIASSPEASPEIASSPKASPEIASSPKASPEIASSSKESPEIASSSKESPEIASSPKASQEMASSPKESQEMASSPKESQEMASSPKDSQEMASSPKDSQEMASSPKDSQEMASSPKDSQEMASSPKDSQEMASSPKDSQEMASSPKDSQEMASSPKESQEIASSPEESQAIASSPEESQAIASSPEANQAIASSPEANQAIASSPEANQAIASSPEANQAIASSPEANQAIASSPEANQAIASSPEANQAIASSPEANQAIASSPEANQAIASSPLANQAIASSPLANQAIASSPLANQDIASSPLANQDIASSPLANQDIATSPLTITLSPVANQDLASSLINTPETPSSLKHNQEIPSSSQGTHETLSSPKLITMQESQPSASELKVAELTPRPGAIGKRRCYKVVSEIKCNEVMSNVTELLRMIVNALSNKTFQQRQILSSQLDQLDSILATVNAKPDASLDHGISEDQMARQNILHHLERNHKETKDLPYPDFKRSFDTFEKLFKELNKKIVCAKAKETLSQLESDIRDLLAI